MSLPAFLESQLSPETKYFAAGQLVLESGQALDEVKVAYRTWGKPANAARRAVLICHALTGSADVESWWPGVIGSHSAFDPAVDYIICSNILGGCYGTTGPASLQPGGAARYRADFPRITVGDMVRLQSRLLDHLGIQELELVTGPSLGGMQALEWAVRYPDRVRSIVPIGVGGKHSAWCIGMSEAQRAAIYADADWNGGYYSDERPPRKGLAAARMMAVCSYRSWSGFQRRFGREECSNGDYQVQSYLRHQGDKINDRFDANSYVRLTQAMNDFDLSRGRGNYIDVLESIRQRALVVSVSSDVLYPAHEQALLAQHLPNARYEILESDFGHDGFLVQTAELSRLISQFRLSDNAAAPAREAAA